MADLPMAQIPNFSLGAQVDPNAASQAYSQVANATTNALQAPQQLNIQRQQLAQQQQMQQAQMQQMHFEQGTSLAKNALDAYSTYGDVVGPQSLETFKKAMNMAVPGSVDPNLKWDESMGDTMKNASKALEAGISGERPWPEVLGVLGILQSKAGKMQAQRMQGMISAGTEIYSQGQTTARQEASQSQNTQRAYAEHAQPLIQTGSALNTINQLLAENTATGDAAAKTLIERNLANGSISKEDADKLTTAGGPLEKLSNYWHTVGTGKTFDKTHREAMQSWVSTKVNEINNTLKATATAFPGAKPAQIPVRVTKKLKSGRTAVSDDGGTTWRPL